MGSVRVHMKAVFVQPNKIARVWPLVEPWVKAALMRASDLSPDQVREHLERGTMQLWLAWGQKRAFGICITELVESVRGLCCNIVAIAGEKFDTWAHLEQDVQTWATEWGCVRMSLIGRKGWVRKLAKSGWRQRSVVMEKVI